MSEQWYACTGGTDFQGRCRNQGVGESQRCSQHPAGTPQAPRPDGVSIKLQITRQRAQVLEEGGILRFQVDRVAREEREIAQAKSLGRDPYRVRSNVADSGTPVFGKNGLLNVRLEELLGELKGQGFTIANVDLAARPDGEMDHLRILLEREVQNPFPLTPRVQEELQKLLASTWQYCHVWANPPRDEKIVHTVNLLNMGDDPAKAFLIFRYGLWGTRTLA